MLIALPLKEKVLICSITILNIVVCRTLTPATPARVIVFGVDFLHLYQFLSISVSGDIFYFCWLSLLTWMSRQCLIALLFLQPWSNLPYQHFLCFLLDKGTYIKYVGWGGGGGGGGFYKYFKNFYLNIYHRPKFFMAQ